jgi:hypothetical protein
LARGIFRGAHKVEQRTKWIRGLLAAWLLLVALVVFWGATFSTDATLFSRAIVGFVSGAAGVAVGAIGAMAVLKNRRSSKRLQFLQEVVDCMSSEHFGQLAWQFKRMSGSSGLKVQAAIAC